MKSTLYVVMVISLAVGTSLAAHPQVKLDIAGAVTGQIVLELYPDEAPVTVANFVDYVQSGFYDGLIFHRVIENFMVQGGGFDINMVKKDTSPAIINESSNGLSNLRGTIAMARTPDPHSATAQFFINQIDNTFLDYGEVAYGGNSTAYFRAGYCVFGSVISGMDIVDAIAAVATTDDVPDSKIIIQNATLSQDIPLCYEKLPGDINGDCKVDLADFAAMTEHWLDCNSITPACN